MPEKLFKYTTTYTYYVKAENADDIFESAIKGHFDPTDTELIEDNIEEVTDPNILAEITYDGYYIPRVNRHDLSVDFGK